MSVEERANQYKREVERFWQREAALAHEEREAAQGPSASTHALWASIDPEQDGPYHEGDWRIRLLDEALRQARADALDDAARLAEDMAFDAIAARIRALADAPAG